MQQVIDYLKKHSLGMLATSSRLGSPSVRPFMYLFLDEQGFCFTTGAQKAVYAELQENPLTEFSAHSNDFSSWIRLKGSIVWSESAKDRERIINEFAGIKNIYKSVENPQLKVFRITNGTIFLQAQQCSLRYSFTGNKITVIS